MNKCDFCGCEFNKDYEYKCPCCSEEVKNVGKEKALDVNGVEIKHNSLVKIVETPIAKHGWLRVGNTLRVVNWENRPFGRGDYIVVFLKSKKCGKHCSIGVRDKQLLVIKEGE